MIVDDDTSMIRFVLKRYVAFPRQSDSSSSRREPSDSNAVEVEVIASEYLVAVCLKYQSSISLAPSHSSHPTKTNKEN